MSRHSVELLGVTGLCRTWGADARLVAVGAAWLTGSWSMPVSYRHVSFGALEVR